MARVIANTFELVTGDIVLNAGMIIKLGEKHEVANHDGRGSVVWFDGTVTNLEQVREDGLVPMSWLCDGEGRNDQWTVQGNELAAWVVER